MTYQSTPKHMGDLVYVNGRYIPKVQHEIEQRISDPKPEAKPFYWVSCGVVFFGALWFEAPLIEAIGLSLIVLYFHWVIITVLRAVRLSRH